MSGYHIQTEVPPLSSQHFNVEAATCDLWRDLRPSEFNPHRLNFSPYEHAKLLTFSGAPFTDRDEALEMYRLLVIHPSLTTRVLRVWHPEEGTVVCSRMDRILG